MAFSDLGTLGSSGSKSANQASIALTTNAAAEVGHLVVLVVACDNNQTTDGDEGAVTSVTDSGGNGWLKAVEMCNGQGTAQTGATVSIWYSTLATQIANGGTITANLSNSSSRDATGILAWEYGMGAGMVATAGATNTSVGDGSAMSVSLNANTVNREALRFRAWGGEEEATTAITPTGGWSNVGTAANSGTGGVATSNIIIRGEYIISTGTSGISAPTGGVTCDWASGYVAFYEDVSPTIWNRHWPNPVLPKDRTVAINAQEFTTAYPIQQYLQGVDPRSPTATRYTPRDPTAAVRSQAEVWQDLGATLRGVVTAPFFQDDWPNPRGAPSSMDARTWLDPTNIQLIGKDQIYGAPGEAPSYDWQNPRGPLPGAITQRTWVDQYKLNLVGQDRFFGGPGQAPANLDWPVPKGPTPATTLKTWLDQTKAQLIGQDRFFGLAGNPTWDWPVPKSAVPNSTLRTWVDQSKIQLIGQDRFFGLAGNPTFDWPVPKGPIGAITLRTWVDQYKLLLAALQAPFSLTDWPNPRGPVGAADLRTWIDQLKVNLFFQTGVVFRDETQIVRLWARDPWAAVNAQLGVWQNPLLGVLGSQQNPFSLTDWPVPRGPLYAIALRSYLQKVAINLIGQDRFFGLAGAPNFDWPNPRSAIPNIGLRTWIDEYKLNLLIGQDTFFGLAGNPTWDWPVPKGYVPNVGLKTWRDQLKLNLIGQDKFFGLAGNPTFDWPVPKTATPNSTLRTWIDPFKLNLVGQDRVYGDPGEVPSHDWPNHRSPSFPIALRSWIEGLKLNLTGQDRIYGAPGEAPSYDWTNPSLGKPYPTSLRTYLRSLDINLYFQTGFVFRSLFVVPTWRLDPTIQARSAQLWQNQLGLKGVQNPFQPIDWPNPRGYIPSVELKTWLDLATIQLIGQDKFFGLAGHPTFDWPNPRGAQFPLDLRTAVSPDLLLSTLRFTQQPFGLYDWPNPLGRLFPSDLRTFLRSLDINLYFQTGISFRAPTATRIWERDPSGIAVNSQTRVWQNRLGLTAAPQTQFFQLDWPNPRGPQYPGSLRTWLTNLPLTLYIQQIPFAVSGWGNPDGPIFPIALRSWLDQYKLNLAGQDKIYGAPGEVPDYDWPNPRGAIPGVSLRTWLDQFKIQLTGQDTFFGLAGHPTFDWPNPRGYVPNIILKTWLDQYKLNLIGQDRFYGGPGLVPDYDWPNPRGAAFPSDLRTFLQAVEIQLIGQDAFFGLAGHPTFDWPNPRGYVPGISLRTWLDPFKIQLIGQDRFFGLAGSPTFDWPNPRGYIPGISLRTWLDQFNIHLIGQDRFFGLAGSPNFDWPNPKGYIPSVVLKTWIDQYKLLLIGQDAFFGLAGNPPFDWPVPKGPIPNIVLRSWFDPLKLNLLGQDSIYGGPGQVPAYDWANPRGAQFPIALRTIASIDVLSTLLAAFSPFFLTDWPLPRGAAFPIDLRTFLQTLRQQLIGQDTFFGLAGNPLFDWPVPKGYGPRTSLDAQVGVWQNSLLSLLSALQNPFFITDWPNPRGYVPAISLRTWIDQYKLLAGKDTFFGLAGNPLFDWPNPRGFVPGTSLKTWIDPTKIHLIGKDQFFGLAGNPPFDWPVPRGYIPSVMLRSWIDQYKLNLVGQDRFFGLAGAPNFDWPNPRVAIPSIVLRSWIDEYKLNLVGQDRVYGGPGEVPSHDWPNPRGPRFPDELRTLLVNLLYSTLAFNGPFSLSDWPNPKGPTFPIALRSWLEELKLNLRGQDRFFGDPGQAPANLDWPVPKGAVPNIALKTWLDQYKLNLAGQDKIHGAPGEVPSYDWPNPNRPDIGRVLRTWADFVNRIAIGVPSYVVNSEIMMAMESLATQLSDPVLVIELLLALTADEADPVEDLATATTSAPAPAEEIASQVSDPITNTEFLTDLARGGMTPAEMLTSAAAAIPPLVESSTSMLADSDLPSEILSTAVAFVADAWLPIEWIVSLEADTYTIVEALRRHSVEGGVQLETILLRITDHGVPTETTTFLEFAQTGPFEFVVRAASDTSGNLEILPLTVGEARVVVEWLGFTHVDSDSWVPIEFGNDATGFLIGGFEPTRFISNLRTMMNRRG